MYVYAVLFNLLIQVEFNVEFIFLNQNNCIKHIIFENTPNVKYLIAQMRYLP